MEDLGVLSGINSIGFWLIHNQELLLGYIVNVIAAIAIIVTGMIFARVISNTVNSIMLTHNIDATIAYFLGTLVQYGIITFTLIAALSRIGVQTASIIAILGSAGLAIGLALQGSLSNLAAGLLLVTFRPFRSGEYVDLNGISGTVLQVQIFSTTLRTVDGRIVIVPNSKIISGNIINFSREPVRRNEFIISVTHDSDIDKVKKLLSNIIESDKRILKDREIIICLNKLSAFSIDFIVRTWSKNNDLQNVYWYVLERIKRDFDANNINFSNLSYPNIEIKLKCIK